MSEFGREAIFVVSPKPEALEGEQDTSVDRAERLTAVAEGLCGVINCEVDADETNISEFVSNIRAYCPNASELCLFDGKTPEDVRREVLLATPVSEELTEHLSQIPASRI